MQVRSISSDGKIYVDSDSFLPASLLGNEVILFSENPQSPGEYRRIEGGTIEAIGAIHFASDAVRSGTNGIKKDQLYLELGMHGENRKRQIQLLGIRPGDSILLSRPIRRGFATNTFYGAYLDNGLGCFAVAEITRLIAESYQARVITDDEGRPLPPEDQPDPPPIASNPFENIRVLAAFAAYEEIGRFGSRVLASTFQPDVIVALDVNHDYASAPNVSEKRFTPIEMGKGYTLSVGSVASEQLNTIIEKVSKQHRIPYQRDVVGRDTGTDAMSGVLASIDAATTSIGFPIRNMHTISETAHTGDVLAAIHAVYQTLCTLGRQQFTKDAFKDTHPRLDEAQSVTFKTMLSSIAADPPKVKGRRTSNNNNENEEE